MVITLMLTTHVPTQLMLAQPMDTLVMELTVKMSTIVILVPKNVAMMLPVPIMPAAMTVPVTPDTLLMADNVPILINVTLLEHAMPMPLVKTLSEASSVPAKSVTPLSMVQLTLH